MRARFAVLLFSILMSTGVCLAQNGAPAGQAASQTDYTTVNCSGFISDTKLADSTHLISGEQSDQKITFTSGDYVYINQGQDKGVKVGDRYTVVRPEVDPTVAPWFAGQDKLLKAMGTMYTDEGQIRVINVHAKVSIAQVIFSCGFMQRGDIVQPYKDRPAPPFKDAAPFDHFAPASGKPVAMVVAGKDFAETYGRNHTVYVNLGTDKGVKVGDYFRIFRYQGNTAETAPTTKGYQYMLFGFGSAPARYEWKDLPRELVGEGIVINVSRNSSTVMITFSSITVYAGDYVELE
jgi:hypothetical protein